MSLSDGAGIADSLSWTLYGPDGKIRQPSEDAADVSPPEEDDDDDPQR